MAIKISRENEEAAARFAREITLSRQMDHPNILNAETSEQEDGSLIFASRDESPQAI